MAEDRRGRHLPCRLFQTLEAGGLLPSSVSALTLFENRQVSKHACGTTLAGDAILLRQFEARYTSSPAAQQFVLEMAAQFRYARHRYAPPTKESTETAMKTKKSSLAHPHEKPKTVPKPKTAARQARLRNATASLNMVGFSFEQVILGSAEKML